MLDGKMTVGGNMPRFIDEKFIQAKKKSNFRNIIGN